MLCVTGYVGMKERIVSETAPRERRVQDLMLSAVVVPTLRNGREEQRTHSDGSVSKVKGRATRRSGPKQRSPIAVSRTLPSLVSGLGSQGLHLSKALRNRGRRR